MGEQGSAACGGDPGDRIGSGLKPTPRHTGIGGGQLQQRHIGGAERHCRQAADRCRDAEAARHVRYRIKADIRCQFDRNGVDGTGKGIPDRHFPDEFVIVVAGTPIVDGYRFIDDDIVWLDPRFQRGEINEQFERRSRLPLGGNGAVVDRRHIILAADHGADRTIGRHRHQCALHPFGRASLDGDFCGALHAGEQGGVNDQRLNRLIGQRVELAKHPIGKIADAVLARLWGEGEAVQINRRRRPRRYLSSVHHHRDHRAGPVTGGGRVGGRRIVRRSLDQTSDDRGFFQIKAVGPVAEELPGRGIYSVGAPAEIDPVQIKFEDLLLAELTLQRQRQHRLPGLSGIGLGRGQEDVAGELLGDGRPALLRAGGEVPVEGPGQTDRIDAGMRMETAVLDRDHRIDHHFGYLGIAEPIAVAGPDRNQDRAIGSTDLNRLPIG